MKLMQCTGCKFILPDDKSTKDWFPNAIACCPDSRYVELNTCTATERAFLDEIQAKFQVCDDGSLGLKSGDYSSALDQSDFDIGLKGLLNEST